MYTYVNPFKYNFILTIVLNIKNGYRARLSRLDQKIQARLW